MRTLLEHLAAEYPLASRTTLKRMVEEGRVTINGRLARRLKEALAESDRVHVAGRSVRPRASLSPLELIHEDAQLLVVHKPAGLLTSTTATERRPTAAAILRRYLADCEPRARLGIIHRLDRDASGLLVFSKSASAFERLKRQFFEHSVERVYLAVVHGGPPQDRGRIESRLVEWADGSVHSTCAPGKGQKAVSEYAVLARTRDVAVLRVMLHTGRKHQIRAHLSELGAPIVGDAMYGPEKRSAKRLHLAAVRLVLTHPATGQRLTFEIPPPAEIARHLAPAG